MYTVGESSKKGDFQSVGCGGPGRKKRGDGQFRIAVLSFMPSIGSGRGVGQSYGRGPAFTPNCSICGRQHLGPCWRREDIARTCYHCGGRGHIARNCPSQAVGVGGSVASGTQSQSSVGSSGRGTERGRGRGRGTGNRDNDQAISGGMRGPGAQITQGQTQARIYNMTREEAPASNDVISGMTLIFDVEAYVLIDPGSTHSYISSEHASKIPGVFPHAIREKYFIPPDFDVRLPRTFDRMHPPLWASALCPLLT
ncbi:UNVERIFIED_CONTAM: hypothetical protein Sradi_5273500 [Sesamum radiatum]|uniref:CCHC-type domain-containing protein n=1 Tax=Sesamum radiatum TaxID=300843 RepID=A0AAW2LLU4_SESRA